MKLKVKGNILFNRQSCWKILTWLFVTPLILPLLFFPHWDGGAWDGASILGDASVTEFPCDCLVMSVPSTRLWCLRAGTLWFIFIVCSLSDYDRDSHRMSAPWRFDEWMSKWTMYEWINIPTKESKPRWCSFTYLNLNYT